MCTPLTHQSMITRLAVMTRVCFLPSPLLTFFLIAVISTRLVPPVFLSLSFPDTSQLLLPVAVGRDTLCLRLFTFIQSLCRKKNKIKSDQRLILAAIASSIDVTAPSHPAAFTSQLESCAAGDRANVPPCRRWALVCKLNCKAHSPPHQSAHIKTNGSDSPIVIYYLAPSVFDH